MGTEIRSEQFEADVLESAFPVGHIYISTLSTSPATLLGFGTWSAFGAGKCLVGLDSGDTDFDTAEETGGAKTVTLTTAQIASHLHTVNPPSTTSGGQSVGHTHTYSIYAAQSNSGTSGQANTWSGNTTRATGNNSATHTHTLDIAEFNSGNTGGGGAHNNLMPYIVVYMWERTA